MLCLSLYYKTQSVSNVQLMLRLVKVRFGQLRFGSFRSGWFRFDSCRFCYETNASKYLDYFGEYVLVSLG